MIKLKETLKYIFTLLLGNDYLEQKGEKRTGTSLLLYFKQAW